MSNRSSRLAGCAAALCAAQAAWAQPLPVRSIDVVSGMPPVIDAANLYSEARAGNLSATVADALPRVYVPNLRSDDVYVIDPATFKVIDKFRNLAAWRHADGRRRQAGRRAVE